MQDEHGQVLTAHSISAGLDYPGVGPEHSALRDSGRVRYVSADDEEAVAAFHRLCNSRGSFLRWSRATRSTPPNSSPPRSPPAPSWWCASPAAATRTSAPSVSMTGTTTMPPGERLTRALRSRDSAGLPALVPYVTAGFPRRDDTVAVLRAAQEAGCAAAEIGIPFSDPLADGPTVQRAGWQALRNGMTASLAIEQVGAARAAGVTIPLVLMTYINPVYSRGLEHFCAAGPTAGADGIVAPDLPADEATDLRRASHGAVSR